MNQQLSLLGSAAAGAFIGWIVGRAKSQPHSAQVVGSNAQLMTETDLCVAGGLVAAGYGHLFSFWPMPGVKDSIKESFLFAMMAEMKRASDQLEPLRISMLQPPSAQTNPVYLELHGDVRIDPYQWLKDDQRSNSAVLSYLKKENDYLAAVLADTKFTQQQLCTEMDERTQEEEDISVPLRVKGYYYYTKTMKGKERKIHCRRQVGSSAGAPSTAETMDRSVPEEILLDETTEVAKLPNACVECVKISPNGEYIAYFINKDRSQRFTLRIKELRRKKVLTKEEIKNVFPTCEWSNDSTGLFYVGMDQDMRPSEARRHILGQSPEQDCLLYTESDRTFRLSFSKTRDLHWICLISTSLTTNEWRVKDAAVPEGRLELVLRKTPNVQYWLEHHDRFFFLRIRDPKRPNCVIAFAPVNDPNDQTVLVQHDERREITCFVLGKNNLTIFCKQKMCHSLQVYTLSNPDSYLKRLPLPVAVQFDEKLYGLMPGDQGDFDSPVLRLIYTSPTTPESVIDQDLRKFEKRLKKMATVLGGFDEAQYSSDRKFALATDGAEIPISLVYRSDLCLNRGDNPVLLHVYGAYGTCLDPTFSTARLSLLDRGFIIALAHVRGGGDLGRHWHEQGKLSLKMTSCSDTITCAKYLIDAEYCNAGTLCIHGRGAGGTTVAAALNRGGSNLFRAAILEAPFLDTLTTMIDNSSPIGREEFEEWGDPKNEEHYKCMKEYSPVDNISQKAYPHMLLTCALNDPRIGYWEAAKFTAKLRKTKTDSNLLLLKNDTYCGDSSSPSNSTQFKELSLQYAFLLKALGTPLKDIRD